MKSVLSQIKWAAVLAVMVVSSTTPAAADDTQTFLNNYTSELDQIWNTGTQYLKAHQGASCIPQSLRNRAAITGGPTIEAANKCREDQGELRDKVQDYQFAVDAADAGMQAAAKVEGATSVGTYLGDIGNLADKAGQAAEVMSIEHNSLGNPKGAKGWEDVSKKCKGWSDRLTKVAGKLNVAENTAWTVKKVCQCTKAVCAELKERAEDEADAHNSACGNLFTQAQAWSALLEIPACTE